MSALEKGNGKIDFEREGNFDAAFGSVIGLAILVVVAFVVAVALV